jgi:hypothetical protein
MNDSGSKPPGRGATGAAGHPQLTLKGREQASTIACRGRVSVQVSVQNDHTPPCHETSQLCLLARGP